MCFFFTQKTAYDLRISDWSSEFALPIFFLPVQARELFIRQALVTGEIDTPLSFLKHNRQLIAAIEKLEHQTRRPDILVDDTLIFAFYDQQIPERKSVV